MAAGHTTAASTDYRVSRSAETAYLAIAICGGQVLIPILLVLSRFRGFGRHPTLLNFLASWLWFSLATCFLLYTGRAYVLHPTDAICTAQVVLQQASLLVVAFSAVSLMLQLWFTLPATSKMRLPSTLRDVLLVTTPYCLGGLYIAVFYAVYASDPTSTRVERGRFTCRIAESSSPFSKFVPVIVGLALSGCIGMSWWMLQKTVKSLFRMKWSLKDGLNSSEARSWLPVIARFATFCVYAILTIVAALTVALAPQGDARVAVDWYTVTLPIVAFMIFTPWPLCMRRKSAVEPTSTVTQNLPVQQSSVVTLVGTNSQDDAHWEHKYEHQYQYQPSQDASVSRV